MSHSKKTNSSQIAIVGAGVEGVASLVQIIRNPQLLPRVSKVYLFDRNEPGKSGPYCHESTILLMNTSVGVNSIFENDPDHFYRWLLEHRKEWQSTYPEINTIDEASFVPRRLYGEYLSDVFEQTVIKAKRLNLDVVWVPQYVSRIQSKANKQVVYSECGDKYPVDFVIMASGKEPTETLTFANLQGTPQYFASPYVDLSCYQSIPDSARVLIIGSRLSAIDTIRLLQSQGFKGKIEVSSRSGLFPAVRTETLMHKMTMKSYELHNTLSGLVMALEAACLGQQHNSVSDDLFASRQGDIDWQQHILPFIFRAKTLWSEQTENEKARFKNEIQKKLSRFINAFQEEAAETIVRLIEEGRFSISSGLKKVTFIK